MQQEETTHSSTASVLRRALSEPQPDPSHRKVATVLERAIAPDMMPVTLQVDDQEVETVQYIAELAEITRHHSAATHTDGIKWRTRSHKTWEI
jgi:hypothetical protein